MVERSWRRAAPSHPVRVGDKDQAIGQGNNAFIFPGLGFGAILAEASEITDGMVLVASYALADYVAAKYLAQGLIYPPVEEMSEVARRVATRVLQQAFDEGVACTNEDDARRRRGVRPRQVLAAGVLAVRQGLGAARRGHRTRTRAQRRPAKLAPATPPC